MSLGGDIVHFRYKELREHNKLKQKDIAKIFGVTRLTYNKWELLINDTSLDTCNTLANFYRVSVDYLLGRTDDKQYPNSLDKINYDIMCQRMKKLRKNNKLSQQEVSSMVGFPANTYSAYERGYSIPPTLKLSYIADFYHCSMDYLLGKIDDSMIKESTKKDETKEIESVSNNCIRFKELRKQNKLRQADVANILNIKTKAYYQYEKLINDISLDNCNRLANYYHVSIDYLLGLTNTIHYVDSRDDIDLNIMGTRLKELRKKQHLKQAELCDKIGFAQTTYSSFERGIYIPTTFKLLDIISYYHVSMDYILGKTDVDNLNNNN